MKKRLATLMRIVEVKEHQKHSAEWRLGRVRRQQAAVLEDQRTTISALNAEQPLHGLFVETMARHLGVLAQRLDALRQSEMLLMRELEGETGKLRQAERMLDDVTRKQNRADEWKELEEVVQAALARGDASLP
jgi:hypothetical protein